MQLGPWVPRPHSIVGLAATPGKGAGIPLLGSPALAQARLGVEVLRPRLYPDHHLSHSGRGLGDAVHVLLGSRGLHWLSGRKGESWPASPPASCLLILD